MEKVIDFLKESNRWKHLLAGILLGFLASTIYCAMLTGTATGAALAFKDKSYSEKFDWIDLACTFVGALIGFFARLLMFKIVGYGG